MLGTAVLFVVVAVFYKPQEHYHDDDDNGEGDEDPEIDAESKAEGSI